MDLRLVPVAAATLCLAGCAMHPPSMDQPEKEEDRFFSLPFLPASITTGPSDEFAGDAAIDAFAIDVVLERSDGARLAAPRVVALPKQVAKVSVVSQTPYVETSAPSAGGEPKTAEEGLHLEVAMQRASDGGVTLGFTVRLSRLLRPEGEPPPKDEPVKVESAQIERIEATGSRWIEPGVQGLLARLTSPDRTGPLLVLARVTPLKVDASALGAPPPEVADSPLARPMSGHTRHLRISVCRIGRELDPGSVVDETAFPDVMKHAGGAVLRDFEMFSCLDARTRMAGTLEASGHEFGFAAQVRDDGALELTWTTTAGTRTASARMSSGGRRFVALARIEGGGTAGVIVSLDADD